MCTRERLWNWERVLLLLYIFFRVQFRQITSCFTCHNGDNNFRVWQHGLILIGYMCAEEMIENEENQKYKIESESLISSWNQVDCSFYTTGIAFWKSFF